MDKDLEKNVVTEPGVLRSLEFDVPDPDFDYDRTH